MRFIDPKDFSGTRKVRMLAAVVAGGRPRVVGEVIELPAYDAYQLICWKKAEPIVEAPRLVNL